MKYGKSEFLSFSIVEIVKIVISEETLLDYYKRYDTLLIWKIEIWAKNVYSARKMVLYYVMNYVMYGQLRN